MHKMPYRLICGLEIHVELKTKAKVFCRCKNDPFFSPKPNIYTCDYCLGRETKAPVPNRRAIELAVKFGLFVGGDINTHSYFERKHYQYPDVPKGYQISQCTKHFVKGGVINTKEGAVHLIEAHLEEDVAKMIHQEVNGKKVTLLDFNRSGVPLIEIVCAPEIHSSDQAVEYAKNIQAIARYLGMSNADMEKGQMRFDANISLQTPQEQQANQLPEYKVEVKNINSFKALKSAIEFEIKRQSQLLTETGSVPQETRGYDLATLSTVFQRKKGDTVDFNATICPDMSKIELTDRVLSTWRSELPPQKEITIATWYEKYQLTAKYSEVFALTPESRQWANKLWEQTLKAGVSCQQLANYLVNKKIPYTLQDEPTEIIAKWQKLTAVDDVDEATMKKLINDTLQAHPQEVARYRAGEKQLLGFFMGQIIKKSQQKLPATTLNHLLVVSLQT